MAAAVDISGLFFCKNAVYNCNNLTVTMWSCMHISHQRIFLSPWPFMFDRKWKLSVSGIVAMQLIAAIFSYRLNQKKRHLDGYYTHPRYLCCQSSLVSHPLATYMSCGDLPCLVLEDCSWQQLHFFLLNKEPVFPNFLLQSQ